MFFDTVVQELIALQRYFFRRSNFLTHKVETSGVISSVVRLNSCQHIIDCGRIC